VGRQDQSRAPLDRRRIGAHDLDHVGEDLVIAVVDLVVEGGDLASAHVVDVDDRVQDTPNLVGREAADSAQLRDRGQRAVVGELAGLLRDARGVIADPLELIADVVKRKEEAEVAGDRRLRGDRHRDRLVHDPLGVVDLAVAGDHLDGEIGIVVDQRPNCLPDLVLDERAHPEDAVLDLLFVAIERGPRAARLDSDADRRLVHGTCHLSRTSPTRNPP
jgi:hypothetical protein